MAVGTGPNNDYTKFLSPKQNALFPITGSTYGIATDTLCFMVITFYRYHGRYQRQRRFWCSPTMYLVRSSRRFILASSYRLVTTSAMCSYSKKSRKIFDERIPCRWNSTLWPMRAANDLLKFPPAFPVNRTGLVS